MTTTADVQSPIHHPDHMIVLFDGVCKLCNASVDFIIDHDPGGRFHFAALQGKTGQQLQREYRLEIDQLDSVVLVEGTAAYTRSTAALRIARRLAFPWFVAAILLILPTGIRDFFYKLVARNRYRWFGRRESCRMPTAELRGRFLE